MAQQCSNPVVAGEIYITRPERCDFKLAAAAMRRDCVFSECASAAFITGCSMNLRLCTLVHGGCGGATADPETILLPLSLPLSLLPTCPGNYRMSGNARSSEGEKEEGRKEFG